MSERWILFGGGAFALEVATYLADMPGYGESLAVSDVIDAKSMRSQDLQAALGHAFEEHRSVETVDDLSAKQMLICIGDAPVRHRIFREMQRAGAAFGTLVHPTAYRANTARIDEGAIIAPFAFIGPKAQVGANCAVNVRGTIGHDATTGISSVISPHADLNGHSYCGTAAFVGSGAVFQPGTGIGDYAKLAAGSVLTSEAGDGFLMHGNPAKGRQMMKVGEL